MGLISLLGFNISALVIGIVIIKINKILKETYSASIGVEFLHIQQADQKQWVQERIEEVRNKTNFTNEGKKAIYKRLVESEPFEQFFDKKFLNYSEGPVPLYLKMFHPVYDNLFFIGMFQPLGCIWPASEQQSKLLALLMSGKWKRPLNIKELCDREVTHPHMNQIKTNRHRITVDFHRFMKDLKSQIKKSK